MRPRLFSSQPPPYKPFPAGVPPIHKVNKKAILFSFSMQNIKKAADPNRPSKQGT